MPTFTVSADQLKYASGSSWTNGQARQGVYGSTRYEGAIRFSGLSALDFENISVSRIKLTVHFGSSGGSSTKYFRMYKGVGNAITGSISALRGALIGDPTVSGAYNATKTLTFSTSSNAAEFASMREHFVSGGQILVIYIPSTRGTYSGGYCYDYLNVTSASLEFTYEYLQSDGTVATPSVAANSAATLNITSYNSAYTHKVTWKFGSYTYDQTLAAGVTSASYTFPYSWLNNIPSATSGQADVILETLDAGEVSLGSYTYHFAITAPSTVKPTIGSVSAAPYNTIAQLTAWGIYVQGKTQADLSIVGAAGAYGSTITSYEITTSPNIGGLSSKSAPYATSFRTNIIGATGEITVTATVTDSRGRTATEEIVTKPYVYAYGSPTYTINELFRSNSSGVRDDLAGVYIRAKGTFVVSDLGAGRNTVTAKITIKQNGGSNIYTDQTLTSGNGVTFGNGSNIVLDATYTVTITVTDKLGTMSTYTGVVNSASYMMHFKKGGKAIGFGMAAGADNTASFGWPVILTKGLSPILLTAGTDLNTVVDAGMYYCPSDATTQTMMNCPTTNAFSLWVGKHAGVHQVIFRYPAANPNVYIRNSYQGVWGSWFELYSTYKKPTYADLGTVQPANGGTGQNTLALARNAMGLGNTTGALPVANGGTGAADAASARTALGITLANLGTLRGTGSISAAYDSIATQTITFATPFSAVPTVMMTPMTVFGDAKVACNIAVSDVTTSTFKIKFGHGKSGATRTMNYAWIAFPA